MPRAGFLTLCANVPALRAIVLQSRRLASAEQRSLLADSD